MVRYTVSYELFNINVTEEMIVTYHELGGAVVEISLFPGQVFNYVAGPLRFRRSDEAWSPTRLQNDIYQPLNDQFGAHMDEPWFPLSDDRYEAIRFEMDNGDFALFTYQDTHAYWLGNTVTPEVLWRTEKETFEEAPAAISRWAERELTTRIELTDPWLTEYEHLTWFFLPVFCSKDGRNTTRRFFAEDAAGFPDATMDDGLSFFEAFLQQGVLDQYRYIMASKLGTSPQYDVTRMRATMAEFTVAKILADSSLPLKPEVEQASGHALDFVVNDQLIEVTRPEPPHRRSHADNPIAAVKESGRAKQDAQLAAHPNALLFVDCTSFLDDEWAAIRSEQPSINHVPTVVFRARPTGHIEGYHHGTLPFSLASGISWI